MTLWPFANGRGSAFLPKRSGNAQHAAGGRVRLIRGAMNLTPGANIAATYGRENFRKTILALTATAARLRHAHFKPMTLDSTTWWAIPGIGLLIGLTRATTTGLRPEIPGDPGAALKRLSGEDPSSATNPTVIAIVTLPEARSALTQQPAISDSDVPSAQTSRKLRKLRLWHLHPSTFPARLQA